MWWSQLYFSWWTASLVCKYLNTELVLYQPQQRPPGERWWPRPHAKVKCLTTQITLGEEVIQNHSCDPYLATQMFRVVNLMKGFFLGALFMHWGACSFSLIGNVLPSTRHQLRGMSEELLREAHRCPLQCEGRSGLVSGPLLRALEVKSCAGPLSEEGLLAMACMAWVVGPRIHVSYESGVESAHNRTGVRSLSLLLKEIDGKLLSPRGHPKEWDWRPWQKEAKSGHAVPALGERGLWVTTSRKLQVRIFRFPWWLRW